MYSVSIVSPEADSSFSTWCPSRSRMQAIAIAVLRSAAGALNSWSPLRKRTCQSIAHTVPTLAKAALIQVKLWIFQAADLSSREPRQRQRAEEARLQETLAVHIAADDAGREKRRTCVRAGQAKPVYKR